MKSILTKLAAVVALLTAASVSSQAAVITFTGGTVTRLDSTTTVTNNAAQYNNVDYYQEAGFRLDFVPNSGSVGSATNVGNYYGAGNDVIHAHWATGHYGGVTGIEITKVGGGTFDLNYFILTSNTDTGGGAASGNEKAWIEGSVGGISTGAAMLLPSEDWGFPATQIFLGSAFDAVDKVTFFVTNSVDCFGMDEFYIDQEAPGTVPEPSSLALVGLAFAGVFAVRRRKS